jgi:hypothetical protein
MWAVIVTLSKSHWIKNATTDFRKEKRPVQWHPVMQIAPLLAMK